MPVGWEFSLIRSRPLLIRNIANSVASTTRRQDDSQWVRIAQVPHDSLADNLRLVLQSWASIYFALTTHRPCTWSPES